jgi:hypothetical protein
MGNLFCSNISKGLLTPGGVHIRFWRGGPFAFFRRNLLGGNELSPSFPRKVTFIYLSKLTVFS